MDIGEEFTTMSTDGNRGTLSFVPEILSMMQSFGDGPKCNPGSAHLIEEVVRTQMNSSLIQCYEIAQKRGVKTIGLPEILFLMRGRKKFPLQIVRLLKHLAFKDTLSSSGLLCSGSSSVGTSFDTMAANGSVNDKEWTGSLSFLSGDLIHQQNSSSTVLNSGNVSFSAQFPNASFSSSSSPSLSSASFPSSSSATTGIGRKNSYSSRIKIATEFLALIDDTILDTYNSDDFVDTIKLRRNIRIDKLTRQMSESEYTKFSQVRSVSISSKNKSNKFKQWLLSETTEFLNPLTIDTYGMEAFQWIAHELVAQIVDYCFLVQQEGKKIPFDSIHGQIICKKNPLLSIATTAPEHSCGTTSGTTIRRGGGGIKRKFSNSLEEENSLKYYGSITPTIVREVTRRFYQSDTSVFNLMTRRKQECPIFRRM